MNGQPHADWAALAAAVPIPLGESAPVLVDQQTVDAHAGTTGDAQWIHNDPVRARRDSPFGGPVVQGFLLLSLLTKLSSDLQFPKVVPLSMMVNYGFDRVRFVRPVPVDAEVWMRATLAEVRPRDDDSAVLGVDVELFCSGADAPAVVVRWLFLAVPAP